MEVRGGFLEEAWWGGPECRVAEAWDSCVAVGTSLRLSERFLIYEVSLRWAKVPLEVREDSLGPVWGWWFLPWPCAFRSLREMTEVAFPLSVGTRLLRTLNVLHSKIKMGREHSFCPRYCAHYHFT